MAAPKNFYLIEKKLFSENENTSQTFFSLPPPNKWLTLFAYRTVNYDITNYEPFYLLYRCMATLPIETDIETILFEKIIIGNYKDILQRRLGTILDFLFQEKLKKKKAYKTFSLSVGNFVLEYCSDKDNVYKEHFKAHNKNNLDFIELNSLLFCLICFLIEEQSSRQFQNFWNWFLNEHSAETYTAYTIYYFDQAYFEDNFKGRNNKEESYQTAPVFNLFSSESEHSTQTVTPEPMAQDSLQQNILIALQDIQTALGQRNNISLPLFKGDAQDPIEWLDDFERAVTANQYDDEYKFQIVGGYLQGFPATWFLQEIDANAHQRIIRWMPANARENNTSFTTRFENKFRTPILISKWCIELERRTQGPGEVVTEYAKAIRKLIECIDSGRNWTKEQKIHSFTKRLRTDLSYAFWPLLALKDNSTINMAIELAQRIEDNQRMHLGSILSVFAPVSVMALAPPMAAISFAAQTQDPNEQLIDRLTANLPKQSEITNNPKDPDLNHASINLSNHLIKDNKIVAHLSPRNNNNQNNRTINNNAPNQRSNHANINFFGKKPLVEATSKSTSQPEENPFYTFNLTDNNHNMNKLAINTTESTKKKKKAKVDFVLDSNKSFTSTANNNKLPKAKVFKNPPKLELPEIVQKSGSYSVVKDLMETPAHITFVKISKKKIPKTNKCSRQAGLADNSNVTLLIYKAQVAGYFIDLILDSGSSMSVIAKHFLEAIGRKIDEPSTKLMTNVHDNKKKSLGIAKAILVCINSISIETDMEVSETKKYTIIVGNEWLKKAKALLDYELCELIIRYGEKPIVVKCCHWTTPLANKQDQEEEQSDELDNEENNEEEEQKEQKKTAKLIYTTFTSNGKPLDNVKADKEEIIVNNKLICWLYYDILRRIFDQKPSKKAKYCYWWHGPCAQCWCNQPLYSSSNKCKLCLIYYKNWKPISLIPRDELKEVQKSFENKPPEIQSLIVKQRESSSKERKIDIENLLAKNSPVISKEGDTPGRTHVIQHTITTRETCPIYLKPYQSNC
ncbi:hypothetical protein G9A89_016010 [Geosiphon pyriformis]|nr:hypothetical protein G9A89_016010 [Geosiphon pyriformis]